jgi:hypothetical protein
LDLSFLDYHFCCQFDDSFHNSHLNYNIPCTLNGKPLLKLHTNDAACLYLLDYVDGLNYVYFSPKNPQNEMSSPRLSGSLDGVWCSLEIMGE